MINILFYGERGIVNGIILDIKDSIEAQKAFLRAIKFADGNRPNWIENLSTMDFIVEPSLSEFGNPDLIIIASETDKTQHVIFLEAKVCCYEDAAIRAPASYKNNASKINIQLALKFRFVEAFKKSPNNGFIEETKETAKSYGEDLGRRLKNQSIIQMCNKFQHAADFSFVALTNDSLGVKPFNNFDYIPPVFDRWDANCHSFGLVSYEMLEKVGVVQRNQGYYGNAARAFLGLPADTGKLLGSPKLTANFMKWSLEQKKAAQKLVNLIQTTTGCQCLKQNGSYSFKVNAVTVVKVFTDEDNSVVLGLRNDNLPEDYQKHLTFGIYRIGVGKNQKSFACAKFSPDNVPLMEALSDYAAKYIDKRLSAGEYNAC